MMGHTDGARDGRDLGKIRSDAIGNMCHKLWMRVYQDTPLIVAKAPQNARKTAAHKQHPAPTTPALQYCSTPPLAHPLSGSPRPPVSPRPLPTSPASPSRSSSTHAGLLSTHSRLKATHVSSPASKHGKRERKRARARERLRELYQRMEP